MVDITVRDDTLDLSDPVMVDGLPGVGLVGKIAPEPILPLLPGSWIRSIVKLEFPDVSTLTVSDHLGSGRCRAFPD